jgi:hypothetical protein
MQLVMVGNMWSWLFENKIATGSTKQDACSIGLVLTASVTSGPKSFASPKTLLANRLPVPTAITVNLLTFSKQPEVF